MQGKPNQVVRYLLWFWKALTTMCRRRAEFLICLPCFICSSLSIWWLLSEANCDTRSLVCPCTIIFYKTYPTVAL